MSNFFYNADIKILAPKENINFFESDINTINIFNLQPMLVEWTHEETKYNKFIFVDFFNEKLYSLSGDLITEESEFGITVSNIIKLKKQKKFDFKNEIFDDLSQIKNNIKEQNVN